MTDSIQMHVVCVIDLIRGKDSKNKDGGQESPVAARKLAYAEIEKACGRSVSFSFTVTNSSDYLKQSFCSILFHSVADS